jgi:hypothetical protein
MNKARHRSDEPGPLEGHNTLHQVIGKLHQAVVGCGCTYGTGPGLGVRTGVMRASENAASTQLGE